MTRELRVVPAADPFTVFAALRDALTGDGPAILPQAEGDAADAPAAAPIERTVPQRIALVIETSGSSGTPKRVALSTDALLASASAAQAVLGGPGQWLLALPAHYIAGINVLTRSLTSQTEPVVMPAGHFDPVTFVHTARLMDAPLRFTSLVPAQLARLIEADVALETLRSFDRILVGGQAMPEQLLASAIELGLNITRTYGSSETGGGCVYDGIPIGDTRIRIRENQVEIGGSVLADGYLDADCRIDEERTAQAFHIDDGVRWYRTQDTGELFTDADGDQVLHVTGRVDDVIVSGGLKVSLAAIERVVNDLPGLQHAVVVSAPHPEWGEVPVLIAERSDSPPNAGRSGAAPADLDLAAIQNEVATVLGPAARPARLLTIDRMPRLASGKPDRRALRALAQ